MHQYQLWHEAIPTSICDQILVRALDYYPVDGVAVDNHSMRSSKVRWMQPLGIDRDIGTNLFGLATEANVNFFGLDIHPNGLSEMQYTEYYAEDGGKYDYHIDTNFRPEFPSHRKLTIVVMLSDPSEYEGGELRILNAQQQPDFSKKGSLIILPSIHAHAVMPVTKGVRKVLVAWVYGPKWR